MEPFYFVQLTDTHILTDPELVQNGVHSTSNLCRAVDRIRSRTPLPAFVILTGDLIGDDLSTSYPRLAETLSELTVPVHYAIGNHDSRFDVRTILADGPESSEPFYYRFEHGGVRFFVLDSQIEGEVGGAIDRKQMLWLVDQFEEDSSTPTIVFVHHPPAPTGVPWLDEHVILNGGQLLGLLGNTQCVRRLFFGHVHMPVTTTTRGVTCSSAPSTCYQFTDATQKDKVVPTPPGYNIVRVERDLVSSYVEYF